MDLKCPKCGKASATETWNKETARYCGGEGSFPPLSEGYGNAVIGYYCPECDGFSSGKTIKEFQ